MFGKRGVISYITVMEIVLGISVALLFFSAASTLGNQERLNEFARAKDVALLIDSIQAVAPDVHYEYPETSFGTTILIENMVVTVVPDSSRVVNPEFYSTSQYGLSFSNPAQTLVAALVNGAFFVINKQDGVVSFSNDTLIQVQEEKVRGSTKRGDVVLSIIIEEERPSSTSFLARLKNSVQGQLRRNDLFSFTGEPTHHIGLELGDRSAIYYSDSSEMKALAQQLQERLESSGRTFEIVEGTPMFKETDQAIQISFTQGMSQQVANSQALFALEVSIVYETFFAE